jgi:hypothetical protein
MKRLRFASGASLCALLLLACGEGGSTGSRNPTGGGSQPDFFDACGGKIVDPKTGAIDAEEYTRQATLWDRATIDCRLGPKFDVYHPNDADGARPTATEVPKQPFPGGYLCKEYQYGTPQGGGDYGSTSGQVAYAPDDAADPGLDRVQTAGWEKGVECYQPVQGGYLGGPHPDPGIAAWAKDHADLGLPVAMGKTEMVETGDGMVVFKDGVVAMTGTQTSGSTHPAFQLPTGKVPTSVALTTYNEFALVTVWDTAEQKGQIAVFALRAPKPGAFSINLFAAPNEGGFDAIHLLGFVDLPDMKTPTAIAAAGNNGSSAGAWVSQGAHAYQGLGSIFADLDYANLLANDANWLWKTDPAVDKGIFASAGGAIVASRWENEVTFLDLTPLFQFVRKVYVDPIKNQTDEALFKEATTGDTWPYTFDNHPEMMPKVVTTVAVQKPTVVRIGNRASANQKGYRAKLKAWVGALDGTLSIYDVSRFSGKAENADVAIGKLADLAADPNPTSMSLIGQYDYGNDVVITSRGNRSVQWISVGESALSVTRTIRDSRLGDPVDADPNDRRGIITIGDFTGKKILSFEPKSVACPDGSMSCEEIRFTGELGFPGTVYWVDTANVN